METGVGLSSGRHYLHSRQVCPATLLGFREAGTFSDVTIDVFGTTIAAHRLVLAANSDYFKTLFCAPLGEASGEVVRFGDSDQDRARMELSQGAVLALLEYLYTGELEAASEVQELVQLAKAADFFQLGGVVAWVTDILRANISPSLLVSRYPGLGPMELVSHLEDLAAASWAALREPSCLLVAAGGDQLLQPHLQPPLVYDPGCDLWTSPRLEVPDTR